MEYTTDEYTQDIKIVNYLLRRKFQPNVRFLFDEMKQVAHIKLWELRNKGNFKNVNYAITCAYYTMLNVLRENKKYSWVFSFDDTLESGATRLEITKASRITADDILRGGELKKTIAKLTKQYSARHQTIIELFLQNHKQCEIAKAVKISQTSVGAVIRDFKMELAKEIGYAPKN